jgi:hypothetical protein
MLVQKCYRALLNEPTPVPSELRVQRRPNHPVHPDRRPRAVLNKYEKTRLGRGG